MKGCRNLVSMLLTLCIVISCITLLLIVGCANMLTVNNVDEGIVSSDLNNYPETERNPQKELANNPELEIEHSNEMDDNSRTENEHSSELPISSKSELPLWFFSENMFVQSVISKETNMYSINTLDGYFMPAEVPKQVDFNYIQVRNFYIAIYYMTPEPDTYYSFSWYRGMSEGDLSSDIYRSCPKEDIIIRGKYYIVYEKGSKLQDVFWEQDGNVFHAVTPVNISNEQVELFCNARFVKIN